MKIPTASSELQPHPHDGRPGIHFEVPWNEAWREAMKQMVPRRDWLFLPELKAWWIAESYEPAVRELLFAHYSQIRVVGGEYEYLVDRHGVEEVLETQIGMF